LLPLIDNENGSFLHYLFEGGLMDQPGTSMAILQAIQASYYEWLNEMKSFRGI
jgi:hypothetical protein